MTAHLRPIRQQEDGHKYTEKDANPSHMHTQSKLNTKLHLQLI